MACCLADWLANRLFWLRRWGQTRRLLCPLEIPDGTADPEYRDEAKRVNHLAHAGKFSDLREPYLFRLDVL